MTGLILEEAALSRQHARADFDCGDPEPTAYLHRYARQNHDSGGAECFVAAPVEAPTRISGFYTLVWARRRFFRSSSDSG